MPFLRRTHSDNLSPHQFAPAPLRMRLKVLNGHKSFDNFGNSVLWQGTWREKTLTWTADSFVAGKSLKERCPINVDSPDKLVVKCEYSTDGGATWQMNVATTLTRAK